MIGRSLAAAALLATAACFAHRQINPERKACSDGCVQAKNRCLIAATTAAAVEGCDVDHRACAAPCQAMPLYEPGARR